MSYKCPAPTGFLVNTYMFMNGSNDPKVLGQRDVKVEPLYSQAQMDAAIERIRELEDRLGDGWIRDETVEAAETLSAIA